MFPISALGAKKIMRRDHEQKELLVQRHIQKKSIILEVFFSTKMAVSLSKMVRFSNGNHCWKAENLCFQPVLGVCANQGMYVNWEHYGIQNSGNFGNSNNIFDDSDASDNSATSDFPIILALQNHPKYRKTCQKNRSFWDSRYVPVCIISQMSVCLLAVFN